MAFARGASILDDPPVFRPFKPWHSPQARWIDDPDRRRELLRQLAALRSRPDARRRRDTLRWRVALCYCRYVIWIARRYSDDTGMPLDDCFQEGFIGLMRAVDNFDPARSVPGIEDAFIPYARRFIHGAIRRYLARMRGAVAVPREVTQNCWEAPRDDEAGPSALPDCPDPDRALAAYRGTHHLSDFVGGRRGEIYLSEIGQADGQLEAVEARHDVHTLMGGHLPPRHRLMLRLRFGLGGDPAMEDPEIGDVFGVSRSMVQRICATAIAGMGGEPGWYAGHRRYYAERGREYHRRYYAGQRRSGLIL